MSDLVGNPEDRFSDVAAQIMSFMVNVFYYFFKLPVKNYVNTPISYTMKMTIQMKKDVFFFFFFFIFAETQVVGSR